VTLQTHIIGITCLYAKRILSTPPPLVKIGNLQLQLENLGVFSGRLFPDVASAN
jgi:hypothetical protein